MHTLRMQRAQEYVKQREVEFKQRERYNRYPRQLPPSEAVAAVLTDEQLDAFTAELLIKELGRTGAYLHGPGHVTGSPAWAFVEELPFLCKGIWLAGNAWDASEAKSCRWLAAVAVGLLRTRLSLQPTAPVKHSNGQCVPRIALHKKPSVMQSRPRGGVAQQGKGMRGLCGRRLREGGGCIGSSRNRTEGGLCVHE